MNHNWTKVPEKGIKPGRSIWHCPRCGVFATKFENYDGSTSYYELGQTDKNWISNDCDQVLVNKVMDI